MGMFVNPAWLPFAISEAATAGEASAADLLSGAAWKQLLESLERASESVLSDSAVDGKNAIDAAAGVRHLLVLLGVGIDQLLRPLNDQTLAVRFTGVDSTYKWGMDCPDALYLGAQLTPGATYRVTGTRGTARYVGLQVMEGMAATANALIDDFELGPDGSFELILSADERKGNWMPLGPNATNLTVRHFFYDWDTELPAQLKIERLDVTTEGPPSAPDGVQLQQATARQLASLGNFVEENLAFFNAFARPEKPNSFTPAYDMTGTGAAAENRPVIGSFELRPDEALVLEVIPPKGLYWSYSVGNPWWETIDYANHQSSLNGHQAVVDDDGVLRTIVAHRDPGYTNWLETLGHSGGPIILRCVATETAPTPEARVVKFDDLAHVMPSGSGRITPDERAVVIAGRQRGVSRRFPR